MDWPVIRIFIVDATDPLPPYDLFFLGKHPCIPRIGEHVAVQYKEHKVIRVEHIVGIKNFEINADVYISNKES